MARSMSYYGQRPSSHVPSIDGRRSSHVASIDRRRPSHVASIDESALCRASICGMLGADMLAYDGPSLSSVGRLRPTCRVEGPEDLLARDPIVPQSVEWHVESMARSMSYYGQSRSSHVASIDGTALRRASICGVLGAHLPAYDGSSFSSVGRMCPNG